MCFLALADKLIQTAPNKLKARKRQHPGRAQIMTADQSEERFSGGAT
jgi:hypothetical protein